MQTFDMLANETFYRRKQSTARKDFEIMATSMFRSVNNNPFEVGEKGGARVTGTAVFVDSIPNNVMHFT